MIKIELRTKTIKTKDGTEFIAFKGFTKKGWTDLRFTKEVSNPPKTNSIIFVKEENLNVNQKGRFPVIWVRAIEKIEEIKYEQKVEDYFEQE